MNMQNKWRVENGINFHRDWPCRAGVVLQSLQLQAPITLASQAMSQVGRACEVLCGTECVPAV